MSDVNMQLLEALKQMVLVAKMHRPWSDSVRQAEKTIAAAEQAQQITDSTRVAWTSLGTVKAMLPELLASDDVDERETAQVIDALVKLVGCQQQAQWLPIETAPRDGRPVLCGWSNGEEPCVCYWREIVSGWSGWHGYQEFDEHPSHWMPLPPEPKE